MYELIEFFDVSVKQHVAVNQFRGKPVKKQNFDKNYFKKTEVLPSKPFFSIFNILMYFGYSIGI